MSDAPSSSIAQIGSSEWFTFEDGLKVQVTKLTAFTIGRCAAGGKAGGSGIIVTVTVQNGTGAAFDASLFTVNLSHGPNGDQADSVYDSDKGLGGGFDGSIAPGRRGTSKFGFAVPKSHFTDIQVEVEASWEHEAIFFEGSIKPPGDRLSRGASDLTSYLKTYLTAYIAATTTCLLPARERPTRLTRAPRPLILSLRQRQGVPR